jgi:membrane associated rhomboid family serine protease
MSLEYRTDEVQEPQAAVEGYVTVRPPVPVYTILMVGLTAVVFLVQVATGFEVSTARVSFDKLMFVNAHEYWRILTGATVHGGLLHVGMNGYAFYMFGKITETISSRAHLAIVFLLAAIGGGVLSLVFLPEGSSVGASGGILGIVGYLTVYAFRRRQFISKEFRKSLLINIGFILIFGLFLFDRIDNYAHIGGLVAGAIYGLVQIPSSEYIDPRVTGKLAETAGLACLGIYMAAGVFAILLMLKVV